jgi:16S rRNA C967 or C1407 C5-methylase (RsmB/RsmF family)/NOL1/NOP2/fmu family ribosome biogenesis protein
MLDAFEVQMRALLGSDWEAFAQALASPAPVSIRINRAKWAGPEADDGMVPWCAEGRYLATRPIFTLDPLLHAGAYYVQEASSMMIAEAMRQLLDLHQPLLALDLAAAPGGKSTLIAGMMSAESLLLANEVIRPRYQVLRQNLMRWGLPNVVTSNHDPADFAALSGRFDLVLIDAPCSGEGLFRKDPDARSEWSPEQVRFCAARQQRILGDAAALLAPGGVLLYSTCTYNDQENADNARWLATETGLDYMPLALPADWNIAERSMGYQLYPHRQRGEGFFLACFRKPGVKTLHSAKAKTIQGFVSASANEDAALASWLHKDRPFTFLADRQGLWYGLPEAYLPDFQAMAAALRRLAPVLEMGERKQDKLVPAHALALSTMRDPTIPLAALNAEQAIRYLRKEDPGLDGDARGWLLAAYEGHALGWLKGLGNRYNNYFPKEWRILSHQFRSRD